MAPTRPALTIQKLDSTNSDESGSDDPAQSFSFVKSGEAPRTISQIKRSRIDLERRYVFLCPLALNKHFEALPHQVKVNALLVFRCRRNTVFPDSLSVRHGRTEARVDCGLQRPDRKNCSGGQSSSSANSMLGTSHYKGEFTSDVVRWVAEKERDGFVFWLKPEKDLQRLSEFLEKKTDLVTERPYKPLLLDPKWWRIRFDRTGGKYVSNPTPVIAALTAEPGQAGPDIDIPVLQEVIYQSNPNLEPLSKWPHAPSMRFLPRSSALAKEDMGHMGFISQDSTMDGNQLTTPARDHTRINHWPDKARDRLDNLHQLWQYEEAASSRRQAFALHGLSTMGGR